jgi:outer membrane protein OmpA-like peptidoglycan-associated protein
MRYVAIAAVATIALSGAASPAADEHLTGNIIVLADNGFAMQLRSGATMLVTVTDETKIRQTNDDIHMSRADLIAGLEVDVEGTTDAQGRLIAQKVSFSKEDLQHAREVKAGLTPVEQAIARNEMEIRQLAQALGLQKDEMGRYTGTLSRHQSQLADHDMKIVATSGTVEATNSRIANLDDYNVLGAVTIYFANGSAHLPKDAKAQLAAIVAKAKAVHGYRLAVEGHASAVGAVPYNTTLSHLRAEAVTAELQQQGVPTANIFVPAAMGVTAQVAPNRTATGQAQNRRVVVTILQNKGIAAPR